MLKTLGAVLLLASGLAITAAPARALQIVVTQVDKNDDGSMTYHFAIKTDQGETLIPGESKATSDFVTVYNFYGLVDGSVKSPAGWEFSSEEFGRTPYWNGYPLVLPVDVPGTPNLTWTVTKPVAAGAQIAVKLTGTVNWRTPASALASTVNGGATNWRSPCGLYR
jgi:hypothetical protein